MIVTKFRSSFSTLRFYTNIFTLTNSTDTLTSDFLPLTLYTDDSEQRRVKFPTTLLFAIMKTSKRYVKGNKPDYFRVRNTEMMELGCWNWKLSKYEQINEDKAIVGSIK